MTEEQKKKLEQQLWNIANELRGKMDADHFRDYILGFIFYKYLSEKIVIYANKILEADNIKFEEIDDKNEQNQDIIEAIKEDAITQIGYFLNPSDLFNKIANRNNFILEDLSRILKTIENSTMGTKSEDDLIIYLKI